jgi:superfamily II DNA or RNA helicase
MNLIDLPIPRVLRPYQADAVVAVERDWQNGLKRLGVVLPTGAGKSTVIGKLVSNAYHRGERIAVIAHRGELLDQMIRDLLAVDPFIPNAHIGLVRAEYDDHTAPIVFAMFQTLAHSHRALALGQRDLLIVDETHHVVAEGYHKTVTTLGIYDGAKFCGFTATMYRSDITKGRTQSIGLGDVIEKISYERNLRWAIEEGYLVPPTGLTVRIGALNALNEIRNVAGDFHQGDLAEVMEAAIEYTVDAIELHARDRRSIVFAASVDAAHQIADLINERGVLAAAAVDGTMSYEGRQPGYQQFRDGEIQVLTTVAVLTEGADFPMCDCVVMARPTRSRVLYSQMVGRALRLYENKTDALVLDLSGSTRQMKLIHLSELVHGMGIETKEVDESGEEIVCGDCGNNMAACTCEPEEPEELRIKVRREGPVDMVTIDLLDEDDTLWLETPAGVPFISLSDGWLVFVWPRDADRTAGEWAVGSINTRTKKGGWTDMDLEGNETYYPLATALRKAQEWVVDSGFQLPSKFASWRKRNQAPSDPQTMLARRLNIPAYEGMTKARLSDEISIAFAARVLDPAMTDDEAEEA